MKHVVFTVFEDAPHARRAIEQVLNHPRVDRARCKAVVHEDGIDVESTGDHYGLQLQETDAWPAAIRQSLVGAVVGALIGAAAAWLEWLSIAVAPTAMLGAVAGALMGALAAVLVGVGLPHRSLKDLSLEQKRGRAVVTFEASSREMAERIEEVLREIGAPMMRKRLV